MLKIFFRVTGSLGLACALLTLTACGGRTSNGSLQNDAVVRGRLGTTLDAFLTQSAAEGFSGAVLVAKNGEVILQKGYGLADRARGIPNSAHTIFNICSMSKIFTATAILHLEMQGKLKLSDRLEKHLGNFPGKKSTATIHHLLTHTAGLVVGGTEVDNSSRVVFIQAMKDAPFESVPGEEYRYTNVGYSLLAALVEEVSGQSFESYVQKYLLKPTGMTDTAFLGEIEPSNSRLARGYHAGKATEPADLGPFVWGTRGAGGMLATLGDLYAWELALRNNTVLSEEATKKMFTAYFRDEGYGWHVNKTDRGTTLHHRGCGNPGFEGQFARYPDDDVTILLTSNNRNGWRRPIWEGIELRVFKEAQN